MSKLFAAQLLFEAEIDGVLPQDALSEESIRLFIATDADEARRKAQAFGLEEQHSYSNEKGQEVAWRFRNVVEIQELDESELSDGIEVFSKLTRKSDSG